MTPSQVPEELHLVATSLRAALDPFDLDALAALLDEHVRWGGDVDTPQTCHTRTDVLNRLAHQRQRGVHTTLVELEPGDRGILVGFSVREAPHGDDGHQHEHTMYQVLEVRHQRVSDIRGCPNRYSAAVRAGIQVNETPVVEAQHITPILNVSNLEHSFDWFAKLGWNKNWDWRGDDGTVGFGAVGSGECEVFLCRDGQGGRGEHAAWLSIWVDDVDALHARCAHAGLEILQPPRDEPWGVREMLVRHPDGHTFRMSQSSQHGH